MKTTLTALNSLKSDSAFAFHHLWQSKGCQGFIGENNIFDTLANDYICDPFVDLILDSLNAYHDYTSPDPPKYCDINFGFWGGNFNVQSRCHIIDLSPYIDYWINRPGSSIACWLACAHNSWTVLDDITDPFPHGNPNSYSGRTFDGSIIYCDQIAPHSNHD